MSLRTTEDCVAQRGELLDVVLPNRDGIPSKASRVEQQYDHLIDLLAVDQALDIAIYEYELLALREAVAAAANRGVRIRLLYHAKKGETLAKNLIGLKTPPLPKSVVQYHP